jgi:hypothetical protein
METIAKKRITTNIHLIKNIFMWISSIIHYRQGVSQINTGIEYPQDGVMAASSALSMEILDNGYGVPYTVAREYTYSSDWYKRLLAYLSEQLNVKDAQLKRYLKKNIPNLSQKNFHHS